MQGLSLSGAEFVSFWCRVCLFLLQGLSLTDQSERWPDLSGCVFLAIWSNDVVDTADRGALYTNWTLRCTHSFKMLAI